MQLDLIMFWILALKWAKKFYCMKRKYHLLVRFYWNLEEISSFEQSCAKKQYDYFFPPLSCQIYLCTATGIATITTFVDWSFLSAICFRKDSPYRVLLDETNSGVLLCFFDDREMTSWRHLRKILMRWLCHVSQLDPISGDEQPPKYKIFLWLFHWA